jgi:hypothetical protein
MGFSAKPSDPRVRRFGKEPLWNRDFHSKAGPEGPALEWYLPLQRDRRFFDAAERLSQLRKLR